MPNKLKKQAAKFFVTFTDTAALVMATFYVVYVCLMLALDLGQKWLNIAMLVITVLYIAFFIVKIFYINKIAPQNKLSKKVKKVTKYTKYGMKIINAVFVVLSIVSAKVSAQQHIVQIVGIITLLLSFTFSILWEVVMYFLRRKVADVMSQWNSMEGKEKKEKVDFLMEKVLETLGNVNMYNYSDYIEYGARATEIVSEKLNNARATTQKKQLPLPATGETEIIIVETENEG